MKYRTIVADPPWDYPEGIAQRVNRPHKQDRERGIYGLEIVAKVLPYSSLSVDEIAALPVNSLACEDARLFLWATNRYLFDALQIAQGWGFAYKQLLVWDKRPNVNPLGGSVAPNSAEFLIVAVRGQPRRSARWDSSIIQARKARSVHSVKPDVFLDLIEQVSAPPYLEMFARRARFGWDYWGDESLQTVDLPQTGKTAK